MVGIISCDDEPTLVTPELAFQAKATTGEGAIWHPDRNTLFWVDIEGQSLYEYFPKQKDCHFWRFDRMVSAVVPETDSTMIVALQDEIIRFHLQDGSESPIASIPVNGGKLRCNDGKCDPAGRLWVGTMCLHGAPKKSASLYRVASNGSVKEQVSHVSISNGIVWSSNKKYMYYVLQMSFAQGLLFAYISASPFIIQEHYGFSSFAFGLLFALNSVAIVGGSAFSVRFGSQEHCVSVSCRGMVICSILLACALALNAPMAVFEALLLVLLFMLGLTFTAAVALAMSCAGSQAGAASALLGAVGFLFGSIVSPIVGLGNIMISSGMAFIVCAAGSSFFAVLANRVSRKSAVKRYGGN